MKDLLKKMGSSQHPFWVAVCNWLRFPVIFIQFQLLSYRKEKETVDLIRKIYRETVYLGMYPDEMFQVYECVKLVERLGGDFAEVGVGGGRTAKLICALKGKRPFHLFDTFSGLPEPMSMDISHARGQFAFSEDYISRVLAGSEGVVRHKGLFPQDSAKDVEKNTFAFVHLDVDLYQSTLDGLKFFYGRMEKGGIILSHDYSTLAAVKSAFSEFFKDKPEYVIETTTSQCLVVKS